MVPTSGINLRQVGLAVILLILPAWLLTRGCQETDIRTPPTEQPATTAESNRSMVRTDSGSAPDRQQPDSLRPKWLTDSLNRFGERIDAIDVDSGHTCRLSGTVVLAGQPLKKLEGVRVRLTSMWLDTLITSQPDFDSEIFLESEALTDAKGRFLLTEVPMRRTLFVVLQRGSIVYEVHKVVELPLAGRRLDLGELGLQPRGSLRGRVVDDGGRPIRGMLVRAVEDPLNRGAMKDQGLHRARVAVAAHFTPRRLRRGTASRSTQLRRDRLLPFPSTRTNRAGEFVLHGIRPGSPSLCLTARDAFAVRENFHVEANQITDIGRLKVVRLNTKGLEILGEKNQPLPHVWVRIQPIGWPCPLERVRTNPKGQVRVAVPEGPFEVLVRKHPPNVIGPIWQLARATHKWPRRGYLQYVVDDSVSNSYVVVSGVSGQPAPVVELTLLMKHPRTTQMIVIRRQRSNQVSEEGVIFQFKELPGERIEYLATASGYATATGVFKDWDRGNRSISIPMKPEVVAKIRVIDPDGQPIPAARVSAVFFSDPPVRSLSQLHPLTRDRPAVLGATDSTGNLTVPGLWDTHIELAATAAGFVQTPMESFRLEAGDVVTIRLEPSARLEGRLRIDERAPERPFEIWARPRDPIDKPRESSSFVGRQQTVIGPDGSFHFNDLYPGPWILQVRAPSGIPAELAGEDVWPEGETQHVHVLAGERCFHTMDLRRPRSQSLEIRGSVDLTGRPCDMPLYLIAVETAPETRPSDRQIEIQLQVGLMAELMQMRRSRLWAKNRRRYEAEQPLGRIAMNKEFQKTHLRIRSRSSSRQPKLWLSERIAAASRIVAGDTVSLMIARPGSYEVQLIGMLDGQRQRLARRRVDFTDEKLGTPREIGFCILLGDVRIQFTDREGRVQPRRMLELRQERIARAKWLRNEPSRDGEGRREGAQFRVVTDDEGYVYLRGIPAGLYRVEREGVHFEVVAGTFFNRYLTLR